MQSSALRLVVKPISKLFRALGDETRLRVVALLAHGELCVCHLQEALEISQPSMSRHLGVLRSAGVVEARRVGTWVYYRLLEQEDPQRAQQLKTLVKSFGKADVLRCDVEKLLKSRGPEACT